MGLTPRATWPQVARRAQALLDAVASGDPDAATYDTPLGPQPLTEGAILVARAQLRDPDVRIQHEIWWEAPGRGPATATATADTWPQAPAAWGWKQR